MRIVWTAPAVNDLHGISAHIEGRRNLNAANRVCGAIYDAVQQLRRHPYRGRAGARAGTRELVVPGLPYIVAYRVGEAVQVLRVWHGAQDRPQ